MKISKESKEIIETPSKAKPFLRWAGGKRWLLKELGRYVKIDQFNCYHEPFVGGGAVFFHFSPSKSILSDFNSELIETYKCIQKDPEGIISSISSFEQSKEFYYYLRGQRFDDKTMEAARFVYLNQMSFNGIYRVNSQGNYNVPYGYRDNLSFDYENIRRASCQLKNSEIICQDYKDSIASVNTNDLIFLDPPYTVTHNTNGFFHYNKKLFSLKDQYELSETIQLIKNVGAFYILTNAAHQTIKDIFSNGDKMYEIDRASLIGGKNAKRGKYSELILTNIL